MGSKHITKIAYVTMFVAAMLTPTLAWGGVLEAASEGPMVFLAYILIGPLCSLLKDVLAPALNVMFDWSLDWTEIPYLNKVILLMQGLAVPTVIAVRIAVGIRSGLFRDGGKYEYSFGEYIFKTILSLIAVAIMPTICLAIMRFGKLIFEGTLAETSGEPSEALAFFDVSTIDPETMTDVALQSGFVVVELVLLVVLICILALACGYQFMRRQIEMLTVSLIAPWISVFAATENDSNQVGDMLKSLFGLVSQQWIQYVLVMIALGFAQVWMGDTLTGINEAGSYSMDGARSGLQDFMLCIASFGAALTVPRLIDRYTFGASSSHVGSLILSNVARMSLRAPIKK